MYYYFVFNPEIRILCNTGKIRNTSSEYFCKMKFSIHVLSKFRDIILTPENDLNFRNVEKKPLIEC